MCKQAVWAFRTWIFDLLFEDGKKNKNIWPERIWNTNNNNGREIVWERNEKWDYLKKGGKEETLSKPFDFLQVKNVNVLFHWDSTC